MNSKVIVCNVSYKHVGFTALTNDIIAVARSD